MKQPRPVAARMLLAASMIAATTLTAACGDDEGAICACAEPRPVVFVELADPPVGGSVEACSGDDCGRAPVVLAEGADEVGEIAVPYDSFRGWSPDTPSELSFTVRDSDGDVVAQSSAIPERRENCCGEYLRAQL